LIELNKLNKLIGLSSLENGRQWNAELGMWNSEEGKKNVNKAGRPGCWEAGMIEGYNEGRGEVVKVRGWAIA
jgi:hypothetical protein